MTNFLLGVILGLLLAWCWRTIVFCNHVIDHLHQLVVSLDDLKRHLQEKP